MNKRVLTVGLTYAGKPMSGVEIENFGLCAFPLHEYDVIIINPLSYSHFMFGRASRVSEDADELHRLKKMNDMYDLDNAFHRTRREKEMELALADRAVVVWCLSAPKRMNFFGYRTTHLGYVAPDVVSLINELDLLEKKGRRLGEVDSDSPFATYLRVLAK